MAAKPMMMPKTTFVPPVIGHRGACGHAPENTLVSFRRAAALGVRWVEFDVRLVESPDGVRTEGETQIDLTDFSVAPPKLWRGLLKVGKVVRVQFDAVLR